MKLQKAKIWLGASWIVLFMAQCQSEPGGTPKPRGYFRIETPQKEYTRTEHNCPYSFEINKQARWISKNGGVCWADIKYPKLKATLQLTYKNLQKHSLDSLLGDAYNLAYKHTVAADAINEKQYVNPQEKVYGMLFKLEGNAASNAQFYLTDSTDHFLRGVLYFYAEPNADSLKPAANFMYSEIVHYMETLQWKKNSSSLPK